MPYKKHTIIVFNNNSTALKYGNYKCIYTIMTLFKNECEIADLNIGIRIILEHNYQLLKYYYE